MNRIEALLCLYCWNIILYEYNREQSSKRNKVDAVIEADAEMVEKSFENKLMQSLIKEDEKIKNMPKRLRRKACAAKILISLDVQASRDKEAIWRMVV